MSTKATKIAKKTLKRRRINFLFPHTHFNTPAFHSDWAAMKSVKNLVLLLGAVFCGCSHSIDNTAPADSPDRPPVAESFAYPVGKKEDITEAKDQRDDWYNAQDFGENNHLGEDWNANTGGNTDCGQPVYAAANGKITYAKDAGAGWGNVLIIEHYLPNGNRVQTLYGHLKRISKSYGFVKKREKIGTVGNASGTYLCHLHFELRDESCPFWNKVFVGYSPVRIGWLDPSDFIDEHRKQTGFYLHRKISREVAQNSHR